MSIYELLYSYVPKYSWHLIKRWNSDYESNIVTWSLIEIYVFNFNINFHIISFFTYFHLFKFCIFTVSKKEHDIVAANLWSNWDEKLSVWIMVHSPLFVNHILPPSLTENKQSRTVSSITEGSFIAFCFSKILIMDQLDFVSGHCWAESVIHCLFGNNWMRTLLGFRRGILSSSWIICLTRIWFVQWTQYALKENIW